MIMTIAIFNDTAATSTTPINNNNQKGAGTMYF